MSKQTHFAALEYTWDGKIRSARELFRMLHDFLKKYQYEHEYHELIDKPGAIEGTARFSDTLLGKKDTSNLNRILLYIGLALCAIGIFVGILGFTADTATTWIIGAVILFAGILFLCYSNRTFRKSIELHVEGETYRARAQKMGKTSSEVYDVVSNCRVMFIGSVGVPDRNSNQVLNISQNEKEWNSLKTEFESLQVDFDKLRPKIEVPEATSSDTED
jgi:hypothetical protein